MSKDKMKKDKHPFGWRQKRKTYSKKKNNIVSFNDEKKVTFAETDLESCYNQ